MTSTVTALRPRPSADERDVLARVRELANQLAGDATDKALLFPDLCLHRFTAPTTYRKAHTFGVTLGVILEGQKRCRFGETEVTTDASRLVVVTREGLHDTAVVAATPQRPFLGLSLCFSAERVARALLALVEAGGVAAAETVPAFQLTCDEGMAGALERLLGALGDPLDRKLLAPLIIDEILFRLLRSPAAAAVRAGVGPRGDATRILDSTRYMREHYAEKLDVAHLARKCGMSPSHFAHRFRAVARVSPKRYLRQVRLDAARALLLGSGRRVSEAAVEVGFESPAHFTREFKRRFGVAPSKTLEL